MKIFIAILVVIAHVVLIYFLAGGRQSEERAEKLEQEQVQPWSPAEPPVILPPETSVPQAAKPVPAEIPKPRPQANDTKVAAVRRNPVILTDDFRKVPAALQQQTNDCRTGILVDWTNFRVLWAKDADRAVPMASITKMMVAFLLMEAVRDDPAISLETMVKVTKEAYQVGGSQVYLDPRESFSIDVLLKCIMIFSANDAAHLLAQFLGGGDADAFVKRMNQRAAQLGLRSMKMVNPHGLPEPGAADGNMGAPRDMAILAGFLLDFPPVVKWSSTWLSYIREDSGKRFQLVNRNRLIRESPGVNGMKTGYTREAGFCVAATCVRDSRVLIAVVTGCESSKSRNSLVSNLFDWGYSVYKYK